MSTLRQMLPEDLLHYCETNRLVEGVLGRGDPLDEQQQQQHEVVVGASSSSSAITHSPPTGGGDHHSSAAQRGNISIGSSNRVGGGLHDHHYQQQQHQQYHPHDHHGRIGVHHRRSHNLHPYSHPAGPAIVGSSVSSSRRSRDPYSY